MLSLRIIQHNSVSAFKSVRHSTVHFKTQLRGYAWRSSKVSVKHITIRTSLLIDVEWCKKVLQSVVSTVASSKGKGSLHTLWLPNAGDSPLLREALKEIPEVRVVVWDTQKDHTDHLQAVADEFSQVTLKQKSFLGHVFLEQSQSYVPSVCKKKDDHGIALIGHIPLLQLFLTNLLSMSSVRDGVQLWEPGYISCFVFISEIEYKIMINAIERNSGMEYSRYIFYNTFYETKLISKIPVKAFNRAIVVPKSLKKLKPDTDHVCLVQVSLRSDLSDKVTHPSLLPKLARMMRVLSRKRSHRVIPTLERLCPDVGIQLIELGISMLDEFKHVPLEMWPDMFKILTSSASYEESALKMLVDNTAKERRRYVRATLSAVTTNELSSTQLPFNRTV